MRHIPLFVALSFVAISSAAPVARADDADSGTFDTVDAVHVPDNATLTITGLVAGENATLSFYVPNERSFVHCERMALLSMSKPGKYVFTVEDGNWQSTGCKLALTGT
jgi:hypothetical protein